MIVRLEQAQAETAAADCELARLADGQVVVEKVSGEMAALSAMLDTLVAGELDDPATVHRARALLADLIDPFEAYPHPD